VDRFLCDLRLVDRFLCDLRLVDRFLCDLCVDRFLCDLRLVDRFLCDLRLEDRFLCDLRPEPIASIQSAGLFDGLYCIVFLLLRRHKFFLLQRFHTCLVVPLKEPFEYLAIYLCPSRPFLILPIATALGDVAGVFGNECLDERCLAPPD
jgi:hypothetical protein